MTVLAASLGGSVKYNSTMILINSITVTENGLAISLTYEFNLYIIEHYNAVSKDGDNKSKYQSELSRWSSNQ